MMERAERDDLERGLRNAVGTRRGPALEAALTELGWRDALGVDPPTAVSVLFELQGTYLSSSSALDDVLRWGIGLEMAPDVGIVLPELGQSHPPADLKDETLTINGLGSASLQSRGITLVIARTGGTEVATQVPTRDLTIRPVPGIDPDLGLMEVTGTLSGRGLRTEDVTEPWSSAVAVGQLAIGYELVGAARRMLEVARLHAIERVQFGQPISMFQAVRHRLAETLVAIESADAVLQTAWEDISPMVGLVAKALAGRAARTASRHCQQVLAGIGFTTEHEFHRYARRVFVLDQLLGGTRTLTRQFGTDLLTTGHLPDFAPL
jgi:hypothetical protein